MANNIDRAIKLCNAAPNAALPKVIKAGLTRANKGELEISNAIEEATLEVVPIVSKRTPTLGGLANIATLLGLLGTIIGLIQAFAALESAAPDARAAALAKGISIAMNTTAFGLIVAIPCMGAQMFLQAVTKKILEEIDGIPVIVTRTAGQTDTLRADTGQVTVEPGRMLVDQPLGRLQNESDTLDRQVQRQLPDKGAHSPDMARVQDRFLGLQFGGGFQEAVLVLLGGDGGQPRSRTLNFAVL